MEYFHKSTENGANFFSKTTDLEDGLIAVFNATDKSITYCDGSIVVFTESEDMDALLPMVAAMDFMNESYFTLLGKN